MKCKYRPTDLIEFRIWGALTAVFGGGGSVTTRIEADNRVYILIDGARQLEIYIDAAPFSLKQ
jgi:hypothetical protein